MLMTYIDHAIPEAWAPDNATVCDLCGDLVGTINPERDERPVCAACLESGLCRSCLGQGFIAQVIDRDGLLGPSWDEWEEPCDACLTHGVRGRILR